MDDSPARGASAISEISVDKIQVNPDQPRRMFNEEALDELAVSISEIGIIQPISVRKLVGDTYQIIAGERRYRAAIKAGLQSVPAYVRTASDLELTEMALIENIQREDLNAIEIALTFRKLIDQYSLTQEKLSDRIGKSEPPWPTSCVCSNSRQRCSSVCATGASTWGMPVPSCRSTIPSSNLNSTTRY